MAQSPRPPGPTPEALAPIARAMELSPHAQAIGVEIGRIEAARAWGRAPWKAELVGDPDTGVVAGGVVTTLLDTICGAAVVAALEAPGPVATLDLRIDYMRPAEPGADLLAEAHCYKVARHVAFVRATAYEQSPDDPIAHAAAAFMLDSSAGRQPGANLEPRKKPRA